MSNSVILCRELASKDKASLVGFVINVLSYGHAQCVKMWFSVSVSVAQT